MKRSFLKIGKKAFVICMVISLMVVSAPELVYGNQLKTEQMDNEDGKENSWRYKNGTPVYSGQSFSRAAKAYTNAWNKVNGMFVNDMGSPIPGAVKKGIDVSHHQGKIDWEKVKASGIDFAVIRCGFGMDEEKQDDIFWQTNVSECERLNIPYGVYLYSYADTTAKARSEADHVIRLIQGRNLTYPIYYDLEDKTLQNLSSAKLGQITEAFMGRLKETGYSNVGVYSSKNWWSEKLTSSVFNKYPKWVAQYNSICTYTGNYQMWQCTQTGKVNGINGYVDLNFQIQSIPAKSLKLNKTSLSVKKGSFYTLKSYLDPKNAYPQVKWSSSSSSVAAVSSSGKVTGKKVGTAVITAKSANGKKAVCRVTVIPKTNRIKKLKKSGSKGIKITWSKTSGVTRYQIYMSKKKTSGYKRIKTVSAKKFSYTKGKLKKKKRYYFKVRSYQTVKKKKIYSSFSKVKSIKR